MNTSTRHVNNERETVYQPMAITVCSLGHDPAVARTRDLLHS